MRFTSPLALAVVHDSIVHGSWERIGAKVKLVPLRTTERGWIATYVAIRDAWLASIPRLRSTRYRTRFFQNQIKLENWEMNLPFRANGVAITDATIDAVEEYFGGRGVRQTDSAVGNPPLATPQL